MPLYNRFWAPRSSCIEFDGWIWICALSKCCTRVSTGEVAGGVGEQAIDI